MIPEVTAHSGLADQARRGPGPRSLWRGLWLLGAVAALACLFTVSLVVRANPELAWLLGWYALVGFADIAVGLMAWARRPSNSVGTLLCVAGFLTICSALWNTTDPVMLFVGGGLQEAPIGALLHLVIASPPADSRTGGRRSWSWPDTW